MDKDFDQFQTTVKNLFLADDKHRKNTQNIREEILNTKASLRQETLEFIFEKNILPFIKKHDANAIVKINKHILSSLIYSYFYDIDRIKSFHEMERANEPKKAAYLIKWISSHRPIYYEAESISNPSIKSFLLVVNEYYALRCGLAYSSIELKELDTEIVDRMLYDFIFRATCENTLSLWFETYYLLTGKPMGGNS